MNRTSQTFEWTLEPLHDAQPDFMPSRLSEFSSLDALDPTVRATIGSGRGAYLAPEAKRSPPSGTDLQLSALVPPWLESLPREAWPGYLCEFFPRVANRLALCWRDPELTVRLIEEFLADRRGTRRGFPPQAKDELVALRKAAFKRSGLKVL